MKIALILVTAIALGFGLTGAYAWAADAENQAKQFTVNEFTVYSIQDLDGSMKAELFSGPLSVEQKLALMPGGQAPASVNVYLIKGSAGFILVDTGWGRSGPGQDRLAEQLKEIGLSHGDIDLVILTHMHPDHIGGLLEGSDPAFPKAKILVARQELEYWSGLAEKETPAKAEPEPKPVNEPKVESKPSVEPAEAPKVESEPSAEPAEAPEVEPNEPSVEPGEVPKTEPEPVSDTDDWANKPLAPGASADQDDEEPASKPAKSPVAPDDLPQAVIKAYGQRLTTFEFDQEIGQGLTALSAVGHTPGHTIFLLESGEHRLLFIGDLLHAAALQFPEPEESASYDQDPAQAVATRKAVMQMAVDRNLPVAGAHIPFPGIGQVKADGRNGFEFTPVTSELN